MLRTLIQNENFVLEISIYKATSQKPVSSVCTPLYAKGVPGLVWLFGLQVQAWKQEFREVIKGKSFVSSKIQDISMKE